MGSLLALLFLTARKKFSSWVQMISYGVHIDALCHMNIQRQKTKTPWLFWPLALNFVVMVSLPIQDSRSKDKAPAVVFIAGFSPECDNWYFDAWDHC